jgi:cyclophilin family peptidyl-prolyl cis-trans isomerase
MTTRPHAWIAATMLLAATAFVPLASQTPAAPVAVFETVKGSIEIEFFPEDAPKSVAHLTRLVDRAFYRGQRIHRVTASLVQFGDPQSRNMTLQDHWGRSGSGTPIGVAEISKRTHTRGTVALAHSGNPAYADSQLFILKANVPSYNGEYTIVGRVVRGMDVVDKLRVPDMIKMSSLKKAGQSE